MPTATTSPVTSLLLTSSAFSEGGAIPAMYTCDGQNIDPPLSISGVPKNAKSLALTLEDPDAPSGTFVHWVVYNIDSATREIGQGTEPMAAYGKNGTGKTGYTGPCPPSGTHRYYFKLYALDTMLPATEGLSKEQLLDAMHGHIIGMAQLMGTYKKK